MGLGRFNRATLFGKLGTDPQVCDTQDGNRVVTFTLTTSEAWTDTRSGERGRRTVSHRVVIFAEALGRIAEEFLAKGAKVYVEGVIHNHKSADQPPSTEIHLTRFSGRLIPLDRRPDDEAGAAEDCSRPQCADHDLETQH